MKPNLLRAALTATVMLAAVPAVTAQEADQTNDWREEYAYILGVQAFTFGLPYVYLPTLRWDWVTQPKPPGSSSPYAPLNHFYNGRTLVNAS